MPTLKNRQLSIPNGYRFYQPQTNWDSARMVGAQPSFDSLVQSVIAMRKGNPALVTKYGWATDVLNVSSEVDAFNAAICAQMGWVDYLAQGGPASALPFSHQPPSLLARSARLVAGGRTLIDWLRSGAEAVPQPLAVSRADVCRTCPHNESGDLASFFTAPVSEAIREAVSQRKDWALSTPMDDSLGVCSVCYCPLKLKVHLPIADIRKRLPADVQGELPAHCWIKREAA